ncbi:peptidase m23 [Leptolyngbya sp. Heron Island J]|uniref:peptidoglycan DD-metalloendopeptidase family protein n=1 Tax=Leptolyngbya sp. Heron Island J TaxID=1385935 RepID=UPI0003B951F1|nr:peptidoglycan DD-metalloendopeptidase family protein [Leptolyngbya sp. Heron Island J]ESA33524.1 peptidase m23 [Leptolyngbya sp. Heron Island J]
MLGLALSVGASGVLFADSEATAAVESFAITTSANSSESPQLPSVLHGRLEQPLVNGQAVYHTVEQGDSLWQIAKEHHVEIQDIKLANRISPDATLQVGQVIKVPSEESVTSPTLVSLLPGVQGNFGEQTQTPNLERLVAGIPNADNSTVSKLPQAANELSRTVDAPAVVATEELTGDVSLRSAGLVSQSDGFQADLKRLESSNQTNSLQTETVDELQVELPTSTADASIASSSEDLMLQSPAGYEVRPGDTVEDIAISLGTTSDRIAETNGLDDPDFIVAGETLAMPEEVIEDLGVAEEMASLDQDAPALTASSSLSDFDGTRLSRLQSTVENRINSSSTLQRLRGGQGGAIVAQPDTLVESEISTVTVEDPYTADLLAEVSSAQELLVSADTELASDVGSLDADSDIALNPSTLAPDTTVVNPEFQSDRLEARAVSTSSSSQQSELLAAAPLDPSVYVSSPTPAAGQVVSPEMPIMPSADEYLPEAPDYFNGYIWPTHGTLTSGYGWRWGRMHRGIDVAGPVGTPIVSAAAGVVERAGWNSGGYGNLVEVRHADGSMTRYAHNSRITVRPGQRVAQGQHIADMGSTGYSTGPHLHFEVHLPDRGTVNPMAMLPNR